MNESIIAEESGSSRWGMSVGLPLSSLAFGRLPNVNLLSGCALSGSQSSTPRASLAAIGLKLRQVELFT
ncbi:MAG: hypothetical protein ACR2PL_09265 [Dehalococcoidia bacterium]